VDGQLVSSVLTDLLKSASPDNFFFQTSTAFLYRGASVPPLTTSTTSTPRFTLIYAPSTNSILASLPSISLHGRNTQRPSPISPTTQPSPTPAPCIPNSYSLHSPEIPLTPRLSDQALQCDVAPMKGFVHEVLRRSRTSGSVLQTALCYLEAIRAKVPELVTHWQEKVHPGSTCKKESVERIVQGEVNAFSAGLDGPTSSTETSTCNGRRSNRRDSD
jgi:hypothetical protein